MSTRGALKRVLGGLPLAAELDWALRSKGQSVGAFKLDELKAALPAWVAQTEASPLREQAGKKVLLFATLHYWLGHAALTALGLAGLGHQVSLAYLPYANWQHAENNFDLRRADLYTQDVLRPASSLLDIVSFLDQGKATELPSELAAQVEGVSVMDTQYTLQLEEVDQGSALFKLRRQRNRAAAAAARAWMQREQPELVLLPNGLILEFGAVFHAARHLDIPVVSYEFGEQRDRIWLAKNQPVMLQDTDAMWAARQDEAFSDAQRAKVEELFATRQKAGLFQNFYRQWQNVPATGADQVRAQLHLDNRPVVLLAANVIGDSLTLGRATFTGDMSSWLRRTLDYFAQRVDVQFVLRVHPGEKNLDGPSVADLVHEVLPELPAHMRLVAAGDPVNTYDLVALADLGLVYTTTVGMEMAMSGLPVIVLGRTHYRGKGFTLDPANWDEYWQMLDRALAAADGGRLSPQQVDRAWHYAYRFFFDYPQPFPWHLLHFWGDAEDFSLEQLFSPEGQQTYGASFEYLLGADFDWSAA